MHLRKVLLCATALLSVGAAGNDTPDSASYWLSRAQTDAAQLSDPVEKAGVFTALGDLWADAHDSAAARAAATEAIPSAQRITDAAAQFHVYLGLAELFDRVSDATSASIALAGAQSAADAMPAGPAKAESLRELLDVRTSTKGIDAARQQIDAIADPATRAQAYAGLASQFAINDHADAYRAAMAACLKNVAMIQDPGQTAAIKMMVAHVQADADDFDGAQATAESIKDPGTQAASFTALATSYTREGQSARALAAIAKMSAAAEASVDDRKAAIWLDVARARQAQNDTPGARAAIEQAVHAADRLQPADRADAVSAASRVRAELGDQSDAAVLADAAMQAAKSVTDPSDRSEVMMGVAAARARAGLGAAAMECVGAAEAAGASLPPEKRHPQGDPPPAAYLDVIHAAAAAGDFVTAQNVATHVRDASVKHDAAIAMAAAEVNLGQYQAAETTAHNEGSVDAEASVCGMIASQLARTRNLHDADQWVQMLPSPSDKVAARLAVSQWMQTQSRLTAAKQPIH